MLTIFDVWAISFVSGLAGLYIGKASVIRKIRAQQREDAREDLRRTAARCYEEAQIWAKIKGLE